MSIPTRGLSKYSDEEIAASVRAFAELACEYHDAGDDSFALTCIRLARSNRAYLRIRQATLGRL